MLEKDGQFLTKIMTTSEEISKLHSVSYDAINDCLWVGLEDNHGVCRIYKQFKQHLKGKTNDKLIEVRSHF